MSKLERLRISKSRIDAFSDELNQLLIWYGFEMDHHCEFVTALIHKQSGETIGRFYGTDTEVQLEEED